MLSTLLIIGVVAVGMMFFVGSKFAIHGLVALAVAGCAYFLWDREALPREDSSAGVSISQPAQPAAVSGPQSRQA